MAHGEVMSCHPKDDEDIINFLAKEDNKAATMRKAVRLLMQYETLTEPSELIRRLEMLPELVNMVQELKAMLRDGSIEIKPNADEAGLDKNALLDIMEQMDEL